MLVLRVDSSSASYGARAPRLAILPQSGFMRSKAKKLRHRAFRSSQLAVRRQSVAAASECCVHGVKKQAKKKLGLKRSNARKQRNVIVFGEVQHADPGTAAQGRQEGQAQGQWRAIVDSSSLLSLSSASCKLVSLLALISFHPLHFLILFSPYPLILLSSLHRFLFSTSFYSRAVF